MRATSLDYYNIEELLTDEERAARDRARRFVQEEVLSEIVPCHRVAKFPEHLIPQMGALRFYAPYLKEHGCAGGSYTGYGLIMQELERGDSGLRSLASVQGALAIQAIHAFGSPEQQARWLPGLISGERVGCFALTEHGHGSDPAGMETRARRDGNHYILNGSKCWIGNASIAGHRTTHGAPFYRLDELDTTTVLPLLLEVVKRYNVPEDREELRHILSDLESSHGPGGFLLVLSGDHGVQRLPEHERPAEPRDRHQQQSLTDAMAHVRHSPAKNMAFPGYCFDTIIQRS